MRNYIEKRLETLIGEHTNGTNQIRNLEAQLTALRETVTRITGAITVCQETLRDVPKLTVADSALLAQQKAIEFFKVYEKAYANITEAQIAAAVALENNTNALADVTRFTVLAKNNAKTEPDR